MAAGRKKLPTNLKLVKGTLQNCRENEHEPTPPHEGVKMPSDMTPEAKKHWRKISAQLKKARVLTVMDVDALAAYCELYAGWRHATDMIATEGPVVIGEKGFAIRSPWFEVSQRYLENMKKMLTEFGMTPASRPKITAPSDKKQPKSGWDDV